AVDVEMDYIMEAKKWEYVDLSLERELKFGWGEFEMFVDEEDMGVNVCCEVIGKVEISDLVELLKELSVVG
ncbi:hypothetical protein, partial [Bacillus mycoides]|uniref:hypothetical protein n=1 Tax=Bacillus mycoides TaxID=1405 RepID=UPI001C92C16D